MNANEQDDTGPEGRGRRREGLAPELGIQLVKAELIQLASEDPGFRDRLIADPASVISGALSEEARAALPGAVTFSVVQETPERFFLVIPHRLFEGKLDRTDPNQIFLTRALAEPSFRKRLKSDPRAVVEEAYFVELPANVEITVLEESRTERVVVLPVATSAIRDERLREDLIAVQAQGWCGNTINTVIINLCPPNSYTDPQCLPTKTNIPTDPDCPGQICSPTWTYGL